MPLFTEEAQNELFFDEEEVLAGAGGEQRADMLAHYDNLLEMPSADTLDEVHPALLLEPACSTVLVLVLDCCVTGTCADTALPQLLVRDPSRFDDANDDEDEDVENVSNGHMQPPRQ